jgi:hypothetical protein
MLQRSPKHVPFPLSTRRPAFSVELTRKTTGEPPSLQPHYRWAVHDQAIDDGLMLSCIRSSTQCGQIPTLSMTKRFSGQNSLSFCLLFSHLSRPDRSSLRTVKCKDQLIAGPFAIGSTGSEQQNVRSLYILASDPRRFPFTFTEGDSLSSRPAVVWQMEAAREARRSPARPQQGIRDRSAASLGPSRDRR